MIKLLSVFFVLFITGCVSNIPLTEQIPTPHYTPKDSLIISVVDNRKSVKEGKPKSYVGIAHGLFGIPTDCEIEPWVSVEDGDEKKDLSKFIQHRAAMGLKNKGWIINEVNLTNIPNAIEADALITKNNAKSLLILKINEWAFDLNLNAVGSFDLDTDTDIIIYSKETGQVFIKNIAENDDIDLKGDDSHRNQILKAYREQLNQILNDLSLQQALQNIPVAQPQVIQQRIVQPVTQTVVEDTMPSYEQTYQQPQTNTSGKDVRSCLALVDNTAIAKCVRNAK